MNIFSIFTLPKNLLKAFSKENIQNFLDFAASKIIEHVQKSDMLGIEKKAKVDIACIEWIKEHININHSIVLWIRDNLIIPNVSVVTQGIYNFLKAYIDGLTKSKN